MWLLFSHWLKFFKVTDVNNVYDIVDEKEYEKKVRERQVNDWIVDDGMWITLSNFIYSG